MIPGTTTKAVHPHPRERMVMSGTMRMNDANPFPGSASPNRRSTIMASRSRTYSATGKGRG
jgi:hypothetical protein